VPVDLPSQIIFGSFLNDIGDGIAHHGNMMFKAVLAQVIHQSLQVIYLADGDTAIHFKRIICKIPFSEIAFDSADPFIRRDTEIGKRAGGYFSFHGTEAVLFAQRSSQHVQCADLYFALAKKGDMWGVNLYLGGKNSEVAQPADLFVLPHEVPEMFEAVAKGQKEAATALGLTPMQSLRFVVLPQAIRIAIPPIINQYLNLTKNSSLALAIGFQELFSVGKIAINQAGRAVPVFALVMATYLVISLLTSFFLNLYNRRIQFKFSRP